MRRCVAPEKKNRCVLYTDVGNGNYTSLMVVTCSIYRIVYTATGIRDGIVCSEAVGKNVGGLGVGYGGFLLRKAEILFSK